jgi:hypothetical protein
MANQPNLISAYTLAQPITALNPRPIVAKRAPTTSDTGYILGQLWIYSATNAAYILTSVAAGAASWQSIETSGGAGSFTTLTSTGATTLATTGASTNTFGNTTGATSLALAAGTGGLSLTATNGLVSVAPLVFSGASTTPTVNGRVGRVTITGLTTASGSSQTVTITNSNVTTTSAVLLTVNNLNASTNGAEMTLQSLQVAANTLTVIMKNNGGGALGTGDNVNIAFWVLS